MTTHKPDLDPKKCADMVLKIKEYKTKLDNAHNQFIESVITADVLLKAIDSYTGAVSEFDDHCGTKVDVNNN